VPAFDQRYIVIGDVHGNWRSTEILLEKAHYQPGKDRLIFVGDYNDYLPYSNFSVRTTVHQLIKLHQCAPEHVFFVRGNHDLWFRDWLLHGGETSYFWRQQGGDQTLESYGISVAGSSELGPESIPSTHKDFICDLVD
jgi:serine/threonine protein phosphatase 1